MISRASAILRKACSFKHSSRSLLLKLKKNQIIPIDFIADGNDISNLPAWVKTPKQTTDGHLLELAATQGAELATLDRAIPGACLIP